MADLAAPRSAEELHFTHGEGGEVVVQQEALVRLAVDMLDLLLVVRRAERGGHERLRFAARKHRGPVHPRQHADLRPDLPNFVEAAPVEPLAALQHFVAQHLFLQVLDDPLRRAAAVGFGVGNRGDVGVHHLVHARVVLELAPNPHCVGQRPQHSGFRCLAKLLVDRRRLNRYFRVRHGGGQFVDRADDLLDRVVAGRERLEHLVFRDLLRTGFHHHDRVEAAGNHQVQPAPRALGVRRVDQQFAVDLAHPHCRNRLLEGDPGDGQRGGCASERQHIGVVVRIRRQHQRDDLGFPVPAARKQRTDRPIDEPAGEYFLLGRFAFALEEPARNAS